MISYNVYELSKYTNTGNKMMRNVKKVSNAKLLEFLRKHDSDEPGMSPVFGMMVLNARKEAIRRGIFKRK